MSNMTFNILFMYLYIMCPSTNFNWLPIYKDTRLWKETLVIRKKTDSGTVKENVIRQEACSESRVGFALLKGQYFYWLTFRFLPKFLGICCWKVTITHVSFSPKRQPIHPLGSSSHQRKVTHWQPAVSVAGRGGRWPAEAHPGSSAPPWAGHPSAQACSSPLTPTPADTQFSEKNSQSKWWSSILLYS